MEWNGKFRNVAVLEGVWGSLPLDGILKKIETAGDHLASGAPVVTLGEPRCGS